MATSLNLVSITLVRKAKLKWNLIFQFSTLGWSGGILTEYLRNTHGILILHLHERIWWNIRKLHSKQQKHCIGIWWNVFAKCILNNKSIALEETVSFLIVLIWNKSGIALYLLWGRCHGDAQPEKLIRSRGLAEWLRNGYGMAAEPTESHFVARAWHISTSKLIYMDIWKQTATIHHELYIRLCNILSSHGWSLDLKAWLGSSSLRRWQDEPLRDGKTQRSLSPSYIWGLGKASDPYPQAIFEGPEDPVVLIPKLYLRDGKT